MSTLSVVHVTDVFPALTAIMLKSQTGGDGRFCGEEYYLHVYNMCKCELYFRSLLQIHNVRVNEYGSLGIIMRGGVFNLPPKF